MKTTNKKSEERRWCVYCHTNKINGKKYFGLTCQKPEYRWGQNGQKYQRGYFYNAIMSYGWDNFQHEIIKRKLTLYEARDLEREMILKYQTNDSRYGYNLTKGGDTYIPTEETNSKRYKPVVCIETGVIYKSAKEAAEATDARQSNITGCCKGRKSHKTTGGYHWAYVKEDGSYDIPDFNYAKGGEKRRVICIETGVIYDSISEAERATGANSICLCCQGKLGSSNGLRWAYIDSYGNPIINVFEPQRVKKVICLDTGKIYQCATDAYKETGISIGSINRCCHGEQYTAGSYMWAFISQEGVISYTDKHKKVLSDPKSKPALSKRRCYYNNKSVICIETGITYDSIAEASRLTGLCNSSISNCLSGKNKTSGGYHWEHLNEDGTIPEIKYVDKKHSKSAKPVRCVETDIIYRCAREASEDTGACASKINLVCNGKRKTTGGFHWEYVTDDKPSESD